MISTTTLTLRPAGKRRQDGTKLYVVYDAAGQVAGRVWARPEQVACWQAGVTDRFRDFAVRVVAAVNAGQLIVVDRSLHDLIRAIEDVLRDV